MQPRSSIIRSAPVEKYISEITVTIEVNKKESGEEGGTQMEHHGKAELDGEAKRPLVSGYSYYGTAE